MIIQYPAALDGLPLPTDVTTYNAAQTIDRVTMVDLLYMIAAIEKKLGCDNSTDPASSDARSTANALAISAEIAARLASLAALPVVDGVMLSVVNGKIVLVDSSVTGAKLVHDNTRTKVILTFDATGGVGTYAKHQGIQLSAGQGVLMLRPGSVTGGGIRSGTTSDSSLIAYGTATFSAGDLLSVYTTNPFSTMEVRKNGSTLTAFGTGAVQTGISTIEIELD